LLNNLQTTQKNNQLIKVENYNDADKNDESNNMNETDSTKDSIIKQVQARDQLDIIREANKIMRERSKNNGAFLTTKVKSKKEYIMDNKEICLKNYLIDLLKDKRSELNDKEIAITKSLKECETRLEKDLKEFVNFVEKDKNKMKEQEQV
jgi:hypothetical protein